MLNKEKYAKEIIEIACNGDALGKHKNGEICSCSSLACSQCEFSNNEGRDCTTALQKWANSEYKEHEIDWNKVPVDTCLLINDPYCSTAYPRHFAEYYNKKIYVYPEGTTSWSFNSQHNSLMGWDEENVQIKEGVDCSEWYKD